MESRLVHVCEVCDLTEVMTPEQAFEQGWDYPPRLGAFGVLSPRTCGGCAITDTLWWKVAMENYSAETLTDRDKRTRSRIQQEPDSLQPPPRSSDGDRTGTRDI